MVTTLQVGSVIFGDPALGQLGKFEIPESLDSLGGTQMTAIHNFPGGDKVVQGLGAFPSKLTWKGILLGGNAFSRAYALTSLRTSGLKQTITYGPWTLIGFVTTFEFQIKHENYIEYSCEIEILRDNQNVANIPQTQEEGLFANMQLVSSITTNYLTGTPSQITQGVLANVLQAMNDTQQNLYQNGGVLSNITVNQSQPWYVEILNSIQALQGYTNPATNDGLTVSQAYSILNPLNSVNNILTGSVSNNITTVNGAINPSLPRLAAQYYGDASLWPKIATANQLLDTNPTGIYNLIIPR